VAVKDVKLTIRIASDLHDRVANLAEKRHRSFNSEVIHRLRHQHWTDSDMLDWARAILLLPANPPYVLENSEARIEKAFENFKSTRL